MTHLRKQQPNENLGKRVMRSMVRNVITPVQNRIRSFIIGNDSVLHHNNTSPPFSSPNNKDRPIEQG